MKDLPDITEKEISYAIKKIDNRRTPKEDGVVIEAIKIAGPITYYLIK